MGRCREGRWGCVGEVPRVRVSDYLWLAAAVVLLFLGAAICGVWLLVALIGGDIVHALVFAAGLAWVAERSYRVWQAVRGEI